MTKCLGVLPLTFGLAFALALVSCAHSAGPAIQSPATGAGVAVAQVSQSPDMRQIVWNQLSESVKDEVDGSWENAKGEQVVVQNNAFRNADSYKGKTLIRISFKSAFSPSLGPVTVFVDPRTQTIVGYGFRD